MKFYSIAVIMIWSVMVCGTRAAGAENVYVSDVREISKRLGPSTEHRIVRMLAAGSRMEVLSERNGWLQVRGQDGLEGWILKRYTSTEIPVTLKYENLREEHETLYHASKGALDRIAELEEINKKLLETLSDTSNKLLNLDKEHAVLLMDAANVLELRSQYEQVVERMATVQDEVEALREQNRQMKSWDRFYWFLSGGSVFLVAWLTGLITGRLQGKRRNTLQYT